MNGLAEAIRDLPAFLVLGVTTGSIYGLAGTGLVLTYKTSAVFNFAYGAFAAAAAYLFYALHVEHGIAWPIAAALVVAAFAYGVGGVLARVAGRIAARGQVATVVATVGALVVTAATVQLVAGGAARQFPEFLPTATVTILGVVISYAQLIKVGAVAIAATGLWLFFQRTRTGKATRALVEDPELLALSGTDPAAVRRTAWRISSGFAAASGILIAPVLGLEVFLLTLLVVQAFSAAAVGRLTSLSATYIGGLTVGILTEVSRRFAADVPALRGLPSAIPFLVLFVVLLLLPRRGLTLGREPARSAPPAPLASVTAKSLTVIVLAIALAAPWFAGARLSTWTASVVYAIIFLSLALLVSTSRQISLCHAAFVAVGAAAIGHLTTGLGLPWLVALPLAGAAAIPLGAAVAIPAMRLSGLYLALATFGFGILVERLGYARSFMFGAYGSVPVEGPPFASTATSFHLLAVGIAVLLLVVVVAVARGRLGRLLRAFGDSPLGLAHCGVDVNVGLVLIFCLSAFAAAVGGAMLATQFGVASGTGLGWFQSLLWFVVLGLFGRGLITSAVLAAATLILLRGYLPGVPTELSQLAFGVGAIAVAVLPPLSSRPSTASLAAARSPGRIRPTPAPQGIR